MRPSLLLPWPTPQAVDQSCLDAFELATKIVSGVRNFRKERYYFLQG